MTLDIFWIDCWLQDKLFGLGLLTIKREELIRSLFSIYWNDGELLIDLFWFRILTTFPSCWFIKPDRQL
jgi:hypothetical protein